LKSRPPEQPGKEDDVRRLLLSSSVALFCVALPTPAGAQCGGCTLDYVNAYYTQERSFYFDASVPTNIRNGTSQAMQNWNDAGDAITGWNNADFSVNPNGVIQIVMDSNTQGAGQWCYPGSFCDSNPNGQGTIRIHPDAQSYSSAYITRMMAHELGHTLGWNDETDCSQSIMANNWSVTGPTWEDICWINGGSEEHPCTQEEQEYCLPVSTGPKIKLPMPSPAPRPLVPLPPGGGRGRGGGGGGGIQRAQGGA
jgi:hypothetical protein